MPSLSGNELLAAIGVEKRRDEGDLLLPALGLFGAGVVVGATLGLLFAPKPGAQLRKDIGEGVKENQAVKALQEQVRALSEKIHAMGEGKG